jgi:hypothetical protein
MHAFFKVIKNIPQNKASKNRLKIENQKCPRLENYVELSPLALAKI